MTDKEAFEGWWKGAVSTPHYAPNDHRLIARAFLAGAKHGRETEREACAELVFNGDKILLCTEDDLVLLNHLAEAIRARGDQ